MPDKGLPMSPTKKQLMEHIESLERRPCSPQRWRMISTAKEQKINMLLEDGWEPFAATSIQDGPDTIYFRKKM